MVYIGSPVFGSHENLATGSFVKRKTDLWPVQPSATSINKHVLLTLKKFSMSQTSSDAPKGKKAHAAYIKFDKCKPECKTKDKATSEANKPVGAIRPKRLKIKSLEPSIIPKKVNRQLGAQKQQPEGRQLSRGTLEKVYKVRINNYNYQLI